MNETPRILITPSTTLSVLEELISAQVSDLITLYADDSLENRFLEQNLSVLKRSTETKAIIVGKPVRSISIATSIWTDLVGIHRSIFGRELLSAFAEKLVQNRKFAFIELPDPITQSLKIGDTADGHFLLNRSREALQLLATGDSESALYILRSLLWYKQDDPNLFYAQAIIEQGRNEFEKARQTLRHTTHMFPAFEPAKQLLNTLPK